MYTNAFYNQCLERSLKKENAPTFMVARRDIYFHIVNDRLSKYEIFRYIYEYTEYILIILTILPVPTCRFNICDVLFLSFCVRISYIVGLSTFSGRDVYGGGEGRAWELKYILSSVLTLFFFFCVLWYYVFYAI